MSGMGKEQSIWLLLAIVCLGQSRIEACSGRKVFTDTWGIITDGPGKYPASAHCEWLIQANGTGKYISLEFVSMETECSYDYLFIYDGNSYDSPLLGSFSGKTLPDKLLATSGYMLIYFYSDRNYVLNGFYAKYSVTPCAYNCSGGQGACVPDGSIGAYACSCRAGYAGRACELVLCPDDCGSHGQCEDSDDGGGLRCVCDEGYVGYDCSLAVRSTDGGNKWYTVAPAGTGFEPRTGHVGAFIESEDSLYLFGGFTLNQVLDELIRFSFVENRWIQMEKSDPWPLARREHAVAQVGERFYIFGGILSNGSHSNELWQYNPELHAWTLHAAESGVVPKGVASHTLTVVNDEWLYLFGGRTEDGHFLSDMYRINLDNPAQWEVVRARGGKTEDRRLVGHSCVFHPETQSLLIFGGFLPDNARFPKRTNTLHAYHVGENYWTEIGYNAQDPTESPKDRAFHSAVIMGNYMVIYGGNTHIHNEEEICYDVDVYFYHLTCHRWVDYHKLEDSFPSGDAGPGPGRFSQVAVAAYGNILLVSGGYKGSVLADLMAYTVMLPLAKNKYDARFVSSQASCYLLSTMAQCREDPECAWCNDMKPSTTDFRPAACIQRSMVPQLCSGGRGSWRGAACPGVCAGLGDCGSCSVQGQGGHAPTVPGLAPSIPCAWCVKEAQCQKRAAPRGRCSLDGSEVAGWWGMESQRVTELARCRLDDYPAGLHWLHYRYPPDLKHPDEVYIVRNASEVVKFEHEFERENSEQGEYTVLLSGYLHPLNAKSSNGLPLQLWLVATAARAKLRLSTSDSKDDMELVAELEQASFADEPAERAGGSPLLPAGEPRLYMETEARQHIAGRGMTQVISNVKVEWTGNVEDVNKIRQPIPVEYLEPYSSEGVMCHTYTSCLACLTDISCGWCPPTADTATDTMSPLSSAQISGVRDSPCKPRNWPGTGTGLEAESGVCGGRELVLGPGECSVCADHVYCGECAGDALCEWLAADARCTRRGRYHDAVRSPQSCPVPCEQHRNCSSCVGGKNECAWCSGPVSGSTSGSASAGRCFPFVEYVPRYAYGGCTAWLDGLGNRSCTDCARHTACGPCLADYTCGWCGNSENPTIGVCVHGDFVGASSGEQCEDIVEEHHNLAAPAAWSYGTCPDVEECLLGLHTCHQHATCHNTPTGYTCECQRGYTGDGRTACDRTCYHECEHGECSGAPEYACVCEVGWTGERCADDCGCHNHSTCDIGGVGVCDECQHWTTGEHCELCVPGSYGNATTTGCFECECNGHADEKLGFCDSGTGKCYCKDNTAGNNCHQCVDGYYGDPRNGSRCYLQCEGRSILGSITSGALGSHRGRGVSEDGAIYCLWILTLHPDLNNLRLLDLEPTITFTMQTDIKTACSQEFVYVYDGIPSFITASETSSATLLASFCGYGLEEPVSVEATSGYLTVYFEASHEVGRTKGFNATYHVNTCPNDCPSDRRHCAGSKCVCRPGYAGTDCSLQLCPYNCSSEDGHGYCDQALGKCMCRPGYGGEGCEERVGANAGLYWPVYDPVRLPGGNTTALHRMGHSMVSCDDQTLIIFGGYSLSGGRLNDMWQFDPRHTSWSLIEPANEPPTPRYLHCMVCVPTVHAIYLYGGLVAPDPDEETDTEYASNEIWKFSLDSKRWTQVQMTWKEDPDSRDLPALAGHSLTLVGETQLYVIGGMSLRHYYSEDQLLLDVASNQWHVILPTEGSGAKQATSPPPSPSGEINMGTRPTGLYGHSAVYHAPSQAIYVFGGYEYQTDKNVVSSNLYALDVVNNMWSVLPPELNNKPPERFFHAAVGGEEYMVVIGGRTRSRYFTSSVMLYRFSCNRWMDISAHVEEMYGAGPPPVIGAAAVMLRDSGAIYIHGGYHSLSHGGLVRLRLPGDLCQLFSRPHATSLCNEAMGCAYCIVHDTNQTYCYANDGPRPPGCLVENTTVSISAGVSCDRARVESRACRDHTLCGECLTRWPAHRGHKDVCQWCSNCPAGMCVSPGEDCEVANACKRQQRLITHGGGCVETLCQAASCDTCWSKNSCIWTRQFKRSSEVGRTLSLTAIYEWNCVTKSLLTATPYPIASSPPDACPIPCRRHATCAACLHRSNHGAEGGNYSCVWSTTLQQCMAPAMLPLVCSAGECGHVMTPGSLGTATDLCPQPCSVHTQCSAALASPGCGWCALGGLNGLGVAMEGGLMGPKHGTCDHTGVYLDFQPLSDAARNWSRQAVGFPTWAYGSCLPENECLNGHHTCEESENCTDLPNGFRCDCKLGYSRSPKGGRCVPVCSQGCANQGECVEPDKCRCYFGYVGDNCTTECLCNKHSNCESVERRDVCTQCHNHTQGDHCELCEALYVGNAVNGGRCESCRQFCNYHSDVCLSRSQYNLTFQYPSLPIDAENITTWLKNGPQVESETLCILCANHTTGRRCHQCQPGYFRDPASTPASPLAPPTSAAPASFSAAAGCRPCECNGHSSTCDQDTGLQCQCSNHTQTPACDKTNNDKKCWQLQCSACADNFTGTPINGHQCYRQMTVDANYCFVAGSDGNCSAADPLPLMAGRTVFFHVQPKYLNVDIRIILDVTEGGLDLYFSRLDSSFVVEVEKDTGRHNLTIDKRYHTETVKVNEGRKRRATLTMAPPDNDTILDDSSSSSAHTVYRVYDLEAAEFITFLRVRHPDTFLVIRNIQHRLVITLPYTIHNLKTLRFFMVLQGAGKDNLTYGNLVFHQDQPHINLFVFFSVFFSCFFLFLAVCVLIWKSKQAVDVHRTRHRQRMQMEHMASRPFGKVLALLDPSTTPLISPIEDVVEIEGAIGGGDDTCIIGESSTDDKPDTSEIKTPEDRPISPTIIITKVRSSTRSTGSSRRFKEGATSPTSMSSISVSSSCAPAPNPTPPQFHVAPIALEPMDDGIASIGTVLMQLPGGAAAPMQMALGSALISLRCSHYPGYHGGGGGGPGTCRGDAMRDHSKQTLHHRHTTSTA